MIKYTICSLAIGQSYFDIINKTAHKIVNMSNLANIVIITDVKAQSKNRITYISNESIPTTTENKKFFNYNLKFLPIKESINFNTDFIIYIDSDWSALDTYNDKKLFHLFDTMNHENIDFVFERPHSVGHSKHQGRNCFWCHKVPYYNLLETNKYDNAHVCNEQCLIFKNNIKLVKFIEHWEALFWKTYKENIWPFAEGLEIGMSTVEAGMMCDWKYISLLNNCFSFYSIDGGYNERF